jgi:DNA-binding MarR family transcriptional regulator
MRSDDGGEEQILDARIPLQTSLKETPSGHDLAMSLRRAYLTLHRATNACFAEFGLSADAFTVLNALSVQGAMTQKGLVKAISSDANTMSAMLRRLERDGYVIRRKDRDDGRVRIVSLTEKGRDLHAVLWERSEALRCKMIASIPAEERTVVVSCLHQLTHALGNDGITKRKK